MQIRSLVAAIALCAIVGAQPASKRTIAALRVFGQPGQVGLFIAASDGSDEHRLLSSNELDYDPVWAPDGSSIVFTSERDGSADLYRVKPDGTGLERLTSDPAYDDQAAFAPDSRQLVFVTTRGGGHAVLWTIDLATRREKPLTSGVGGDFRPSWSPSGEWIAFSSGRNNPFPFSQGRWERLQLADIYLVRPDGSGLKQVTHGGQFCGSPKWMSDSRHLVAYCMTPEQTLANRVYRPLPADNTRLVSIDVNTGVSSDVPAIPGVNINPSPLSGNDIGYVRKDAAEAESGIYYTSGKRGPRGDVRAASWSPDGRNVVFHKRLSSFTRPSILKTFSRNPGYELNLVATFVPAFSPSGEQFAGTAGISPDSVLGGKLVVTEKATGTAKVVYQDEKWNLLAPQWSPDGKQIIFSSGNFPAFFDGFHKLFLKSGDRVEGGARIAIINSDGTGYRELTSGANNNAFPSFAPDGKRVVFRSFQKDGYGLRIMNLENKELTTITSEYDNFPLWSPRGDLIMFSRLVDEAYEIFTIRPDGTSLKRLTFTHGNDAHMAWSPDGEYIAFASSRMGFKDEVAYTDAPQPYGEIFVMRYDGTAVEQLTDNQWEEGAPAWQRTTP